jgi:iron complex outermembrane receptor protein
MFWELRCVEGSMRGDIARGPRRPVLGSWSRALLVGLGAAALATPGMILAQDNAITLPEVKVIATTPISAPRPRASQPAPIRQPATRPVASTRNAIPAPAPASQTAAVDPSLIERDKVPSNVQTLTATDFDHAKAPSFLDALSQSLPGVSLGDQTGNEFQRDLNYRGFTASPVIGTPQGLAVYQNGVRINEVFGDIVNWDFIPENAIRSLTMMPSNPAFGLNAIGGALSIEMKNGFTYKGVEAELRGGSFGRRGASVEAGGQLGNLSGYLTADAINDSGWRNFSGSRLRRLYADFGALGDQSEFHVNFTGASNRFGAIASTPVQMLNQNWASTYTVPQTTQNQLAFLTASGSWNPTPTLSIQGNLYYRGYWQRHVDGNATDAQNVRCPDEDFLCFPDVNGNLNNLIGLNGQPVPATGALANSVLGQIDRTSTAANSFGGTFQLATTEKVLGHDNRFVIGASVDQGNVQFNSISELGTVNPGEFPFVYGTGIFINQPSGDVAPVGLFGKTLYAGVYLSDTFDVTPRLSVTVGGRYNDATITLFDMLGNNDALNSYNNYNRFNPMIGATYKITPDVNVYVSYAEANRAPTPLELACSDPTRPCLIDSSLVADPPLKQVVSHTYEAGLRGSRENADKKRALTWNIGAFCAENVNDIINVASPLIGHSFFQNVGNTLRRGIEAGASFSWDRWKLYANYTWVDAIFLDPITLSSPFNPFADANGQIQVVPRDHIPAIPNYRFKAGAEVRITDVWKVGAEVIAIGSQYLVGDQSNLNPKVPPYWVFNLNTSYQVTKNVEVFGLVRNLFNRHYYLQGTFFETDSFPYLNLTDPRTFFPGAPLAVYAGIRGTFQ